MRATRYWLLGTLLGLTACAGAPPGGLRATFGFGPAGESTPAPWPVAQVPLAVAPEAGDGEAPSFRSTERPKADLALVVRFKEGKQDKPIEGVLSRTAVEGAPETMVLRVATEADRDRLERTLKSDPDVAFAEPDYFVDLAAEPVPLDDTLSSQQWDLARVLAPEAFAITMGDPGVLVAVVDTGIDDRHADLAGQVVRGWDFINGDGDPSDDQGHGTHCAGTVAALANNGLGVAGFAPRCKVLSVKVLGSSGGGTISAVAEGIYYAARRGAKVISLSLGTSYPSICLRYALEEAADRGAVVVAAAGNDGTTDRMYPAAFPQAIAVGASDPDDRRAAFSNSGDWVEVAAPGTRILSTVPGDRYVAWNGTSMATPHVAALAALLLSRHPGWTATQVRRALAQTGDATTGFTGHPGLRRINALRALSLTAPPTPTPRPDSGGGGSNPPAAPAPTPTPGPTPTPDASPTATPSTTPSATPSPSPTPTGEPLPPPFISITFDWADFSEDGGGLAPEITIVADRPVQHDVQFSEDPDKLRPFAFAFPAAVTYVLNYQNPEPATTYYYRVGVRDAEGQITGSPVYSFTTP